MGRWKDDLRKEAVTDGYKKRKGLTAAEKSGGQAFLYLNNYAAYQSISKPNSSNRILGIEKARKRPVYELFVHHYKYKVNA